MKALGAAFRLLNFFQVQNTRHDEGHYFGRAACMLQAS